jgi:hypothetical protein
LGVKERRREKEEKKEKSEIEEKEQTTEFEREIELEKHSPEIVIEHPVKTETAKAQTEDIEIQTRTDDSIITSTQEQLIPTWGTPEQSEWMYHIPPREEDKDLWAEEWSDYVLKWAEKNEAHILSITTFIKEFPFSEMSNKVDAFRLIADTLIEKEIAEWLDKNERQLRVYWRFLEEWADLIYEWALANGKLRLDVKSMVIQEQEEKFAKLPERDLYIVMSIMVDKGYAKFVDKTSGAIIVKTKT